MPDNNQWGTAFDFYRNDGVGAYNQAGRFFEKVGDIGMELGLEWGGKWKTIVDNPHFQLSDWGSSTSGIKKEFKDPQEFMKTWQKEKSGWIKDGYGYWYRLSNGTYPANKWEVINKHWYLFNRDGYTCLGWHRWDGTNCDPEDGTGDWYFFDNTIDGPSEGACWHTRDNGAQEIWYVDKPNTIS